MRVFLAVLLCFPLVLSAQEALDFHPDFDGDGCYAISDLTSLLCMFGTCGIVDSTAAAGFQPYHAGDSCYSAFDLVPFLALFGTCEEGYGTWDCGESLEYDGYGYATVEIGGQCWFSENLRTQQYTDGTSIDEVLDASSWASLTTGATVIFGEGAGGCSELSPLDACDEAVSLEAFGRLYNGFAVEDPRGLCPAGWHVPSDADWTALETTLVDLGYEGQEGVALKTASGWYNSGSGQDLVGFSAEPGGYRFRNNGVFLDAGASAYFWSSTSSGVEHWFRYLNNGLLGIVRGDSDLRSGFSVRCMLDE